MSFTGPGIRQLKLECLKQAVIATSQFNAPGRDVAILRIAKVMFDWVREIPKEEEDNGA